MHLNDKNDFSECNKRYIKKKPIGESGPPKEIIRQWLIATIIEKEYPRLYKYILNDMELWAYKKGDVAIVWNLGSRPQHNCIELYWNDVKYCVKQDGMFYGRTVAELMEQLVIAMHGGEKTYAKNSMEPLNFKSGISIDNTRSKIVHAWREIENYVRYMTGDETFDIATAWNEEEHGDRIDILNAFKRRTSARIEFGFNSQLEEDIEIHTES